MSNTSSSSTHITDDASKLAIEIREMNDIFIMRPNGKIAYLSYDFYSAPERIVESVSAEKNSDRFFIHEDGGYPSNLYGPIVTKVIDWNLLDEDKQYKVHPKKPTESCKPGYFINLRRMTLDRLEVMTSDELRAELPVDQPITHDLSTQIHQLHTIPAHLEEQLESTPAEDNIYIAFYQHPEKMRSSDKFYSYHLSYISAKELDDYEYHTDSPIVLDNVADEVAATRKHLETHYGKPSVQVGGINPNDNHQPVPCVACYVINIRTFRS